MPKKFRIFLIIFFTLAFIITAPPLIFYAKGYQFDFRTHRLTKTGNLFVDSYPRDALVVVDGKTSIEHHWYDSLLFYKDIFGMVKRQGTTASLISNILPGQYSVEVQKNGYHSWNKKVEILPNQTTSFQFIQLFLNSPQPIWLDEGKIVNKWTNPNKDKIIYQISSESPKSSQQFKLFTTEKESLISLEKLTDIGKINFISFAPNAKNILFSAERDKKNTYFIFDWTEKKLINLNQEFTKFNFAAFDKQKGAVNIKWAKNLQNTILIRLDNTVYSINLSDNKMSVFFQINNPFTDWLESSETIEILTIRQKKLFLEKYWLNKKNNGQNILIAQQELPNLPFVFSEIQPSSDSRFLTNNGKKEFMILSPDSLGQLSASTNVQASELLPFTSKNNYFYYNDHELQILDISGDNPEQNPFKREIINRLSPIISDASLYPTQNYLLYIMTDASSQQNQIFLLEIDNRGGFNNHLIFSSEQISTCLVDSNSYLFCLGKVGDKEGFFKLRIQ
ncbi:MAG: PEGA domain-containing protein [Patescibacteria group bacterium]|nr:PEGA domain-containing protein [Patescibacteria group bacterium]MDD5164141.1 PEGA domain-containing protein [Patescibacteria group bacterium]MDD5534201.1 PEGA domain-containing protein [Patescibacteria group bacterium]